MLNALDLQQEIQKLFQKLVIISYLIAPHGTLEKNCKLGVDLLISRFQE